MAVVMNGDLWLKANFTLTPTALRFCGDEVQLKDVVDAKGSGSRLAVTTNTNRYEICTNSSEEREAWFHAIQSNLAKLRDGPANADEEYRPMDVNLSAGDPSSPISSSDGSNMLNMTSLRSRLTAQEEAMSEPAAQQYFNSSSAGQLINEAMAGLLTVRPKDPTGYLAHKFSSLVQNKYEEKEKTIPYEPNQWHWYIFAAEKLVDQVGVSSIKDEAELPEVSLSLRSHFTSFMPDIIIKAILAGKIKDVPVDLTPTAEMINPVIGTVNAVVVFADASGFTFTTERLTLQPHGAEKLGAFLNEFFGDMIDIIKRWGGDVLKFSGDALTILFPIETEEQEKSVPLFACFCCQEIHENLSEYPTPVQDVVFNFHIGIGYGECTLMEVGGLLHRFEFCAMGPPFVQIALAEQAALAGQTCASPEFFKEYEKSCQHFGVAIPEGKEEDRPTEIEGYRILGEVYNAEDFLQLVPDPSPLLTNFDVSILRKYIPASAYRNLMSRASVARFSAIDKGHYTEEEMRKVSVIFLSIDSKHLDITTAAGAKQLQLLVTCCQRSCYALEGSMNKFLMDDKGIVLLTVFGLPPLSHFYDDPARATIAAMRMMHSIKEQGIIARVGIATGIAWCGVLGNLTRREYTVMGNVVNLAARLMASAPAGGLLCDEQTQRGLKHLSFEVVSLNPITVKGRSEPVSIYRPTGRMLKHEHFVWASQVRDVIHQGQSPSPQHVSTAMNRSNFWMECRQTKQLQECVTKQLQQGGGIVAITGKRGSGKTGVLECLHMMKKSNAASGRKAGFRLFHGSELDPTRTQVVAMLVWEEIFQQLGQFLMSDERIAEEARQKSGLPCSNLRQILQSLLSEESVKLLPLLSELMTGLNFKHALVSAAMDFNSRHKSNRLFKIFVEMLDLVSSRDPVVVLFHIQGSSSFNDKLDSRTVHMAECLCEHIITKRRLEPNRQGGLVFVCCSGDGRKELQGIMEKARLMNALIEMEEMDEVQSAAFFRHCMAQVSGCKNTDYTLPRDLLKFLMDMTLGNSNLIRIVAESCWTLQVARLVDGKVVFAVPLDDNAPTLAAFMQKQSFEEVLSVGFTYFDRLSDAEKLIVKTITASQMEVWSLEQVALLFPDDQTTPSALLTSAVHNLVEVGWFTSVKPELLEDPSVDCFKFSAAFFKQAVEYLVLQVQYDEIEEKKRTFGIKGIQLKASAGTESQPPPDDGVA